MHWQTLQKKVILLCRQELERKPPKIIVEHDADNSTWHITQKLPFQNNDGTEAYGKMTGKNKELALQQCLEKALFGDQKG